MRSRCGETRIFTKNARRKTCGSFTISGPAGPRTTSIMTSQPMKHGEWMCGTRAIKTDVVLMSTKTILAVVMHRSSNHQEAMRATGEPSFSIWKESHCSQRTPTTASAPSCCALCLCWGEPMQTPQTHASAEATVQTTHQRKPINTMMRDDEKHWNSSQYME